MKALTFVSCLAIVFAALHTSAGSNADCLAKSGSGMFASNKHSHLLQQEFRQQGLTRKTQPSSGTDGTPNPKR